MIAPIKLSSRSTGEFWELEVLFEDGALLALDKPPGVLTVPDPADPDRPSLMALLHAGLAKGAPWARTRGLSFLGNAHLLDRDTSGVLLLAKEKESLAHLANQFGSERTEQRYVALVQGTPAEESFRVDAKLAPNPARPGYIRVDPQHGKKSATLFQVLERFAGYALMQCRPLSARPHQLRVHLRSRQLPVVGDTLYGGKSLLLSRLKPGYRFKPDRDELPLIGRVALHAERLALVHPVTGAPGVIEAPWPKDLMVALKFLRRYAPARAGTAAEPDALPAPEPPSDTPAAASDPGEVGGS
jgi:23S rRNA pseudouridine955/2504/2580 synthase